MKINFILENKLPSSLTVAYELSVCIITNRAEFKITKFSTGIIWELKVFTVDNFFLI